ncbi:putative alcohol dehydrogenase [Durotheca rogersii]|uniref:putative alcohol dehydrogenase n=1 Tax=Durotheca rogersii TaxID=419775 RepID=UPI002220F2E3|nr:putative alcohol dehydrogenase [Durotheca rogersii]KAI5866826.1 putative alcohol dehydrogenase [Durotheca rogersii]
MVKAVVRGEGGKAEIQEVPKPRLREGHVLVKVKAIGVNPADWKTIEYGLAGTGARIGLDYVGIVEEVGEGVAKPFKKGDRIAGWVHGGNRHNHDFGSFGDYLTAKAALQFKVPDSISDEEAATFGVSVTTLGQGLYKILGLPFPSEPTKTPYPILIYGGSTATGLYGIQYAKASGLTVIATASPHNFDYVKSLGADAVFDYKSPTCGADIKAFTNNKLKLAWDCTGKGVEVCAAALSDAEESKYATIISVDKDLLRQLNPKVDGPYFHLAYDAFGDGYPWWDGDVPPKPDELEFGTRFLSLTPQLLADGTIRPIRTFVNRGGSGLEGVLKGLDELRAGRVSAGKLVYTL